MTDRELFVTPVVLFVAVFVIVAVLLLGHTPFGRRVYAVGNGERVAALSGVPVSATLIRVYMLSGLCSAIVGALLTGFSGQASLGMGDEYLLPSIAVAVIGGRSLPAAAGIIWHAGGALSDGATNAARRHDAPLCDTNDRVRPCRPVAVMARARSAHDGSERFAMNDFPDVFALAKGLRVLVTAGARHRPGDQRRPRPPRRAVHICDVSDDFLADYRAAHRNLSVTKADVASEADVARLFADVKASLGGLDALINNAGVAGPTGGVEDIAPGDWRRTIDVCLTGQFLCSTMACPC